MEKHGKRIDKKEERIEMEWTRVVLSSFFGFKCDVISSHLSPFTVTCFPSHSFVLSPFVDREGTSHIFSYIYWLIYHSLYLLSPSPLRKCMHRTRYGEKDGRRRPNHTQTLEVTRREWKLRKTFLLPMEGRATPFVHSLSLSSSSSLLSFSSSFSLYFSSLSCDLFSFIFSPIHPFCSILLSFRKKLFSLSQSLDQMVRERAWKERKWHNGPFLLEKSLFPNVLKLKG